MEEAVKDILRILAEKETLAPDELDRILRRHNRRLHDGKRTVAKKRVLPYYLQVKQHDPGRFASWGVTDDLDRRFVKSLQMKPRRTASGVATITVITKPWPCRNKCLYCPNDPAMPKSYLSDEPACQRASRNRFHPYLQVASRLRTLGHMGHDTGKVEVIVLGGTWLDYPQDYRTWFVAELFRALNDSGDAREAALAAADDCGALPSREGEDFDLAELHRANETAAHRMVGLVVETRPDTVSRQALAELRSLGCTKLQMGIQSIDERILQANGRRETPEAIASALDLARLFGFKTHAHFMLNLYGASPASDAHDFATFAASPDYAPDEVKLYPCALVDGTGLVQRFEDGRWRPYTEDELVATLCSCMVAAPPFMRVSRMIRDISAKDILAGNKKTNLRQIVDERLKADGAPVDEIRFREIATADVDLHALELHDVVYDTRSTCEHFLQFTLPDKRIAAFLRLSLPNAAAIDGLGDAAPVNPGEAMIREVHVYGFATRPDEHGSSAQHRGLGRTLVERACEIAAAEGYAAVNVISAVGTRGYYRKLGFSDNGLYQRKELR